MIFDFVKIPQNSITNKIKMQLHLQTNNPQAQKVPCKRRITFNSGFWWRM